jgi:UPF0271 protein
MATIDLNSDLGEGFGPWRMGDDTALLDIVTSANVACGLHAGDPIIMQRTVAAAEARGVMVGAHPGYADLWGFGRRAIAHTADETAALVLYQCGALRALAARVGYVKLHGAMAHAVDADPVQAAAVVAAVRRFDPAAVLLVMPGGALERAALAGGVGVAREVFADRGYDAAGRLLPRGAAGAVLTDAAVVADRVARMVEAGAILPQDGPPVPVAIASVCLHGDTPGAVAMAAAVRRRLEGLGVRLAPFVR